MYGQYSTSHRTRWTKAQQLAALHINPSDVDARKVGHNRTEVVFPSGARQYILHATPVAELWSDGETVTFRDGGWQTMTTRRAMRQALESWFPGSRFGVFSGRGPEEYTIRRGSDGAEVSFDAPAKIRFPQMERVE